MVNSSYSYGPPLSLLWTHFCGQLVSFSSLFSLLFHTLGSFAAFLFGAEQVVCSRFSG